MQTKSNLGLVLTLLSINGITFSLLGFFLVYISRGLFSGAVILFCLMFFAGISLLRDQVSHRTEI